jgi:hypothetical protein
LVVIQFAQLTLNGFPSHIIFVGVPPRPVTSKQNPLVSTNTVPTVVDDGNDAFPPNTVPQQELVLKLENGVVNVGVVVKVGVTVCVKV